ncbi:hypothetical protein GJ496_004229 [Pomphorhynchus laevis]|nr:hypothetical protein GJ496_004229 [Pomphorhynchus laevis]
MCTAVVIFCVVLFIRTTIELPASANKHAIRDNLSVAHDHNETAPTMKQLFFSSTGTGGTMMVPTGRKFLVPDPSRPIQVPYPTFSGSPYLPYHHHHHPYYHPSFMGSGQPPIIIPVYIPSPSTTTEQATSSTTAATATTSSSTDSTTTTGSTTTTAATTTTTESTSTTASAVP